ncbi:DEAD/DEAH box helicase [Demequina globuliformis]|uniref:DEAD/DEAH box helicase n=1 Tax=Demequina globuliformis TaxID=676202 RepID=UPI000785F252|nr:DEAD/DEAH box helicase [Demequina globuliformis]
MTSSTPPLLDRLPTPVAGEAPDPDALYEAFADWSHERGLPLYPHQDEALIEIVSGSHVILATPTGSGKSLVAAGAHFAALAAKQAGTGGRTFYTAPLKALVSEKFFDPIALFGTDNVGLMTGDSAVNSDAPIICCTAEILANLALRDGAATDASLVVMDEFHFYADPQRGWAWQVPLLELPGAQFVLMSATLGDTDWLVEDLQRRSDRAVAQVTTAERPVPLAFEYCLEPLQDVVERTIQSGQAPVYIVHFTQKDAVSRAQSLLSTQVASKTERQAIADALDGVKFATGFGKTLSKFLRAGIGVHHAGMLPKYRRIVERLTQQGLLKVVCGTDTLGVGINVPIRTVLLTQLVKYDGERMRHLTAREFHQIAGRAGRAGFDTEGDVIVMAPEHVIENRKALAKAGDDPKKRKKIVRKSAPQGSVNWTDATFERLRDAEPEPLVSRFSVTHAMVLNVLSRGQANAALGREAQDPVQAMAALLAAVHETDAQRSAHVRQALRIYRSLRIAGVVEHVRVPDAAHPRGERPSARLTVDVPRNFALNQPLSPFALAAMDLLNVDSPDHALDVVSVIESTLSDPRQILLAQQHQARGEAIGAMKADGIEYDERMELLEEFTWPKPLEDLLEPAFIAYRRTNPWILDAELSPKSVVRDMLEKAMSFRDLVSAYGLERTEGVVLRYLAEAYRALRQTVPEEHRTADVAAITDWLGEMVRSTDSSLLDEWEHLSNPEMVVAIDVDSADAMRAAPALGGPARPMTGNPLMLRRLVRNALFRRVELAAREDYAGLGALDGGSGWGPDAWREALDPLFEAQGDDAIRTGADARSAALLTFVEPGGASGGASVDRADAGAQAALAATPDAAVPEGTWLVRQVIDDLDGDHDWAIIATVDLEGSDEAGAPVINVLAVGPQ